MDINFEKETYSIGFDSANKIIELREQIGKRLSVQRMELKDKLVRDALIDAGWTPPWNYDMKQAPRDGTMLLLKNRWFSENYIGSWRKEEEQPDEVEFWWYDNSYHSIPIHPIAWKPII